MSGEPASPSPTRRPFPPLDLLRELSSALRNGRISTGEAAALRRLDPAHPDRRHIMPLMRLLAGLEVEDRPETWQRLTLIANAIALARGRHDTRPELAAGRRLHAIGLSETRLMALLSADFATLTDLLPRIARRVGASNEALDWRPLVLLAWYSSRDEVKADEQRRHIAAEWLRAAASERHAA